MVSKKLPHAGSLFILLVFLLCAGVPASAQAAQHGKAVRYRIIEHRRHADVVKRGHTVAIVRDRHRYTKVRGKKYRVLRRTRKYILLAKAARPVILTGSPVSVGKPCWASSEAHGAAATSADDGQTSTSWTASTTDYPQWWTVDLGSEITVSGVRTAWNGGKRSFRYLVQTSTDGGTFSTVVDRSNSSSRGATTDRMGVRARYVRVQILGVYPSGIAASASEFTVHGEQPSDPTTPPIPTPTATPTPGPTGTTVPGAAFNVKTYGAKADGVTDERSAITAAANAAVAAGGHVYFPAGTYRLAGPLSTVAGAYYYAPSGVTVRNQDDIFGANNATWDGFTFQCYGSATGIKIGQKPNYTPTLVRNMTIKNCSFVAGTGQYTHARVLLYLAHDCTIDHNTFTGTSGSGGNIQLLGGKRNHITNNRITGGTTAILSMWSRSANGGGLDSIIEDNVITGNIYSDYSEEGISFDLKGNDPKDCGALEYDSVRAVDGQTITLSSLAFPDYVGYDVVFVDGALRGRTRTITTQSGNSFTVAGSLAGVTAGDHVTIGACFKDNYVAHNTGTSAAGSDPYAAIILYGLCFGNTIEYNTLVRGKIKVQSLDGLVKASGQVTNSYGRAPCGYNTVQYNSVEDSTGRIHLQYYAIGGGYIPFISEGNNVINNTTPLIAGEHQYAHISGNGGSTSYTNVTKSDGAFVYDGP